MAKSPKPTKTEQLKNLINKKIESGFFKDNNNVDNREVTDLVKSSLDELHFKGGGWRTDGKKIAKDIMRKKNMILRIGAKDKVEGMKVNLQKPEQPPQPEPEPAPQQEPSSNYSEIQKPHGTLPKESLEKPHETLPSEQTEQQDTTEEKQEIPLSDNEKEQQRRINEKLFVNFVGKTYVKLGIIPDDDEEEDAEPKSKKKQFLKECKEFSDELTDYCIEHNIRLPRILGLFSLGAGGFMIFIVPLVKIIAFNPKVSEESKPNYDDKLEGVEA